MSVVEAPTFQNESELQRYLEQGNFELVDGKPVEQHMSALSSLVGGELTRRLGNSTQGNRVGWVFPADNMYRCFPHKPGLTRKPDASFVKRDRLPADQLVEGYVHVHPDLAVEVVSPHDLFDEVNEKIYDWLTAGVNLVWVVCLKPKVVYVHRADGSIAKVLENEELDGEKVLPGFRCRVADLFPTIEASESKPGDQNGQ